MKFDVVGLGHSAVDYLGIVPHYPALNEKKEKDYFEAVEKMWMWNFRK